MSATKNAYLHFYCSPVATDADFVQQIARRFNVDSVVECASSSLDESAERQILSLLQQGKSVVSAMPANTPSQRQKYHSLLQKAGARHLLHYAANKSVKNVEGFVPPAVSEGFNVEVRAI